MTVILPVDVERLLSHWLRLQIELTSLDCGQRIYTEIPTNPTFPLVRVTRFGGSPVLSRPLYLDAALVQFDVWGGSKHTAWKIAETSRALLAARLAGDSHGEGVVTGITFGELRWLPDRDYTPARPRYLFDATVFAHPAGAGGS